MPPAQFLRPALLAATRLLEAAPTAARSTVAAAARPKASTCA